MTAALIIALVVVALSIVLWLARELQRAWRTVDSYAEALARTERALVDAQWDLMVVARNERDA